MSEASYALLPKPEKRSIISGLVMGRRWWAGPGLGRPGPAHQFLIRCAAARPGPSIFHRMDRGLGRPIKFSRDGPRPGPAHHIFKNSRPGPAHHFFKSLDPARPGPPHGSEAHETRALYGPARQLRGPARGFDGPARAVAHEMWCTTATTTTFLGVAGSLSAINSYVRAMHSWQIASGV